MNPMPWTWKLIRANCTGCGICADVCREGALSMPREAAYPEPVPGGCTGCRACLEECPFDAVALEETEGVRKQPLHVDGRRVDGRRTEDPP